MVYDEIPAVRRSDLWEMRKSPAHYLYAVTHPKEPTQALVFGTAVHKYFLERDGFFGEFALAPEVDRRTKAGKAEWAKFVETIGDRIPLSVADYAQIGDMWEALKQNQTAYELISSGSHEVPIEWTDPATGEACKCRPDVLTVYHDEFYIVDYKTTTSCEAGHFERACRSYGYKLQAAMYTEGVFQTQAEIRKFAFVAQEKTPPYAVRVYFCDDGFVDEGMDLYRDLIGLYHKCRVSGEWPGYGEEVLIGDGG